FGNRCFGTGSFHDYTQRDTTMDFYNREQEIAQLSSIYEQSHIHAQMTVITGRRRIGKTQLLLKATAGQPTLYFFVARKSESFLCQDFAQEINDKLGVPILGNVRRFSDLFRYL